MISFDKPLIFRPADTLSISIYLSDGWFCLIICTYSKTITPLESLMGTIIFSCAVMEALLKLCLLLPRDPVCGAASEEPAVHAASDRVTLEGGSGSGHLPTGLSTGSQNTCRTYSTKHVHSMMNKCTKNGTEYSCVWTVRRPSLQRPDVQKWYYYVYISTCAEAMCTEYRSIEPMCTKYLYVSEYRPHVQSTGV